MSTVAFATTGKFQRHDKVRFARYSRSEYYEAEIGPLTDHQPLNLKVEIGLDAPYLVGATTATTPYVYKRKWTHIRKDRADICIVHYVSKGSMTSTHCGARSVVGPGQFIIFRSNAPYELEYHPDGSGDRAIFYASLPPDVVLRHFAGRSVLGRTIAPPPGRHSIAGDLFTFIFERGAHVTPDVAGSLLAGLIKAIAEIPTSADSMTAPATTIQAYRLEKIWSYLALHFTNPDLTAAMVAEACRISPRYLSYLLASSGTTFSQVLWRWRMEKAKRWLQSPAMQDAPIGALALQAGYKSGSHFTQAFREKHGRTPSAYRKHFLSTAVSPQADNLDDPIGPELVLGEFGSDHTASL